MMTTTTNEQLFIDLYRGAFPGVCKYVSKRGGSLEEARDVFQDALLIYMEQTRTGQLQLRKNERAFLFGISRNLWHRHFEEKKNRFSMDETKGDLEGIDQPAESPYQEVSATRLLRLLSKAGDRCMQLLSAFYYEKLDMQEIAERFGFSGARSATVQKFKCLEKVKETVKEKSLCYEDILE